MELSLNQATTRPYGLSETAAAAARAGIRHLGLWVDPVEQTGIAETRRILADHGLAVSSVCRVGFVADKEGAALREALDDVKRGLELSQEVGAPMLTFIAGGLPSGDRDIARAQLRVRDALETLAPHAEDAGVRLALEPLHPLFVTSRSVVTSIAQAVDVIRDLPTAAAGVLIDAYATFWDPRFAESAAAAGERIAGYQISDFALPLPEPENMNGRLFPGDGEIDFAPLNAAVRHAGFSGPTEVEIFNDDIWALDLDTIIERTVHGFAQAMRSSEAVTR